MASIKVAAHPLPPKEILSNIFAFPPNPDSFGGISYLIKGRRRDFMVDVPEYGENNISFIEQSGPPEFIFSDTQRRCCRCGNVQRKIWNKVDHP